MFKLFNSSFLKVLFAPLLIITTLTINGCDSKKSAKEEIEQKGFVYNFASFAEAIESKNTELVDLFIQAEMDTSNQYIRRAVFDSKDPVILKKLLDAGFNPNFGRNGGISFIANLVPEPEMLKVLLGCKTLDIDFRDDTGYTAIERAREGNYIASINLLTTAGAREKILVKLEKNGIRMPDVILDAIKQVECIKNTDGKCISNVISINSLEDENRVKTAGFRLNGHIIRCNSIKECSAQAQALINGGIININLGLYQVNYQKYPNSKLHEYFKDSTARENVNIILTDLVKENGYSWETIGRYHSSNSSENEQYYRKLYAYIYGDSKR